MGHAIHYCTGCSIQLRDPDFEKGAAFRSEARVYCKNCVPESVRRRPPTPSSPERVGEGTSRILKAAPPPPAAVETSSSGLKWALAAGGAVFVIALVAVMATSGRDPVRRPVESPPPTAGPAPDPAPLPPAPNEKSAEEAIRKARDFAQARPDDLTDQLALYDEAVRAAEKTGHHAAALREHDAVVGRQKALVKTQLDAVDAAVRAACEREEFGAALRRIDEARVRPLGSEWTAELARRSQAVTENADKLFAAVKKDAADAKKRGAEDEVNRLAERVAKWEMDPFKSELARAVAAATPKKPPPPPPPPKAVDAYRKKWAEAMAAGSFRDFPGALKKIEEARAATTDAAVQTESAADLDFLKQAISAEEEALQLVAKIPRGTRLTVTCLTETGKVELTGSVIRNENHELELAREKGNVRIPLGELTARTLGQLLKGKREDKGAAILCIIDGDVEGAKGLIEGAAAIPDKYWSFKGPSNPPGQAAARKLFYAAERDLRSHARSADALQRYATLLKDHATTEFVRRNRALIATRAEGGRESFHVFEDLRIGGAFKAYKSERDDLYWRTLTEADPAKPGKNYVEIAFPALPETEYRCWFYVGGCCTEAISSTYQVSETAEPGGDAVLPVKQLPSMQYKTHEAHAGRGRPAPRWGWIQLSVPKSSTAGTKRIRLLPAEKGFCVATSMVSSSRGSPPAAGEAKELERARLEMRHGGRSDPFFVGHWKFAEMAGAVAIDSSPTGLDGQFVNGASWVPATPASTAPPAVKLDGTGYANLGTHSLLQGASALTVSAWICPDKLAGEGLHNVILCLSKNTGGAPTHESRMSFSVVSSGHLSIGARSTDTELAQSLKSTEKVIKAGTWVHVAATVDLATSSITLYLNGALLPGSGTVKFAQKAFPNTPSSFGVIGAEDDGSRYFFNGRLSDLRLYTRLLSSDEIAELAVPGQTLR